MASEGWFDTSLVPSAWLDHTVRPEGWFDKDLVEKAAAATFSTEEEPWPLALRVQQSVDYNVSVFS